MRSTLLGVIASLRATMISARFTSAPPAAEYSSISRFGSYLVARMRAMRTFATTCGSWFIRPRFTTVGRVAVVTSSASRFVSGSPGGSSGRAGMIFGSARRPTSRSRATALTTSALALRPASTVAIERETWKESNSPIARASGVRRLGSHDVADVRFVDETDGPAVDVQLQEARVVGVHVVVEAGALGGQRLAHPPLDHRPIH